MAEKGSRGSVRERREIAQVIEDAKASAATAMASVMPSLAAATSMRWLAVDGPQSSTAWRSDPVGVMDSVLWSKAQVQSETVALSEAVEAMRGAFEALEESSLCYGSRMEAIRQIFDSCRAYEDERVWALSALMDSGFSGCSDHWRAAAIRYLGIYDVSDVEMSSVMKLMTKALQRGTRAELEAASLSLRDIGDVGAIPAIAYALSQCRDTDLAGELQKTADSLVSQDGSR